MSNRKYRTNRVEYLYLLAQKKISLNEAMIDDLVKHGFLKKKRSPPGRQANARRYNSYVFTDKTWKALARRARSNNRDVRVQRSLENLFPSSYSKVRKGEDHYRLYVERVQPDWDEYARF